MPINAVRMIDIHLYLTDHITHYISEIIFIKYSYKEMHMSETLAIRKCRF